MALDLDREQDIEELRRIAQAQQAQIQQLLDVIAAKSREIERLRGKPGDMQLTLKMLEALQAKAKAASEARRARSARVSILFESRQPTWWTANHAAGPARKGRPLSW